MHFASLHNWKKDNNKFKNRKQPELTENKTVWKSNNQGVKEETFIQTGSGGWRWAAGQRRLLERWKLADWGVPHSCANKWGGTTREQDRPHNPGFQYREIKPQNLWLKTPVRVDAAGEIPSLRREFVGETHGVLEHTQTHPSGNQHQKGPICLWVAGEMTESPPRAKQVALFPLWFLPHIQYHNAATWVALPWQIPNVPPLTMLTATLRQKKKNMVQMKEQIKVPKIELCNVKRQTTYQVQSSKHW